MLVTFQSNAFADITMFGDVAVKLVELMGHGGTVPGAIRREDVSNALKRLREGIAAEEAAAAPEPEEEAMDEEEQEKVSLRTRALPLIQLLEAAERQHASVMWHN